MNIELKGTLNIERCPHCAVATPHLERKHHLETNSSSGGDRRWWAIYVCRRCGGLVTAFSRHGSNSAVNEYYPGSPEVADALPARARSYLRQALESLHAPAGSIMLCAAAVDAMLKEQGYAEGSLYTRIDKAVEEGLITEGMGKWAHAVRLEANEQRHADVEAALPSTEDAERSVDFTTALGQLLFVLPAKVKEGLASA